MEAHLHHRWRPAAAPLLALRGDAGYVNATSNSLAAINEMATNLGVDDNMRTSLARYMATAGLEMRWPVLFSMPSSSHIVEPMAQVFVRPNEQYVGGLAVPNEDAQSFVFDATTLFERDKFSGYDRVEGGTRANVGFRYSGAYDNGWSTNAIFGQSYQLQARIRSPRPTWSMSAPIPDWTSRPPTMSA
ncbi:hypothetical protein AJ88_29705 [Mesorhizobium amorphae CCBAU 01583]|nr:hypothetical protein AJ88_29705 [Mesorhizobium amorphae CCBAU 01583]